MQKRINKKSCEWCIYIITNGLDYEECKDAILDVIKNIEFSNKIDLNEIHIDLLRHGEDEQDKLGGWSDNHLTTTGIMQITDVSDYMACIE